MNVDKIEYAFAWRCSGETPEIGLERIKEFRKFKNVESGKTGYIRNYQYFFGKSRRRNRRITITYRATEHEWINIINGIPNAKPARTDAEGFTCGQNKQ